jgi:hypothetical protein
VIKYVKEFVDADALQVATDLSRSSRQPVSGQNASAREYSDQDLKGVVDYWLLPCLIYIISNG